MNEKGVVSVTDFLPRPRVSSSTSLSPSTDTKPLLQWLIRRVEVIRGSVPLRVECAPAFNYGRDPHKTTIAEDDSAPITERGKKKVLFESKSLVLDLRYVVDATQVSVPLLSDYDSYIPMLSITIL